VWSVYHVLRRVRVTQLKARATQVVLDTQRESTWATPRVFCMILNSTTRHEPRWHSLFAAMSSNQPNYKTIQMFDIQTIQTDTSQHIRLLLFSFFSVFHFSVVGSVLTHVGFWAHVKIASRNVSYRMSCNKSTQLQDAFIGQRHDLTGCSETRTVSDRLVLNICISLRPFTMKIVQVEFQSINQSISRFIKWPKCCNHCKDR